MKYLILSFLGLFIILSCKSQQPKKVSSDITYISSDIIFKDSSAFLYYLNLSNSTYLLEWGNQLFSNISTDTLHVLPNGKLNLVWNTSKAICLRQGCGTSCFFSYILPITKGSKEKFYMYPMAFDTLNNLIAYANDSLNHFLTIENFATGRKMNINEKFLKGPYSGYYIDSISFQNDNLYVRWQNDEEKLVSKKINTSSLIK